MVNLVRKFTSVFSAVVFLCSLISCDGRESARETVGTPVSGAVHGQRKEMIAGLKEAVRKRERRLARAELLAELAAAWSRVDRSRPGLILEKALNITLESSLDDGRDAALRLLRESEVWTGEERKSARQWAERALDNDREVRLLVSIAGAWADLDGSRAGSVFTMAVDSARRLLNPDQRDTAFRTIALAWVRIDRPRSERIVGLIRNQAVQAWAWRSLGERMAPELPNDRPKRAGAYFHKALESITRIKDPGRRVRESGRLASAWFQFDPETAREVFRDAVRAAGRIGVQRDFARSVSRLAADWGAVDVKKAFELSTLIPDEYPEERLFVFLAAVPSCEEGPYRHGLFQGSLKEIEKFAPGPDRDRFLGILAGLAAKTDLEAAAGFMGRISPESGLIRDEALVSLALGQAKTDLQGAVEGAGDIGHPLVRAGALVRLAGLVPRVDDAAARKLLNRALGLIHGYDADTLRAELAMAWVGLKEIDRAVEIAEGMAGASLRIRTLAEITCRGEEAESADMMDKVWSRAVREAMDLSKRHDLIGAAELKRIGLLRIPVNARQAEDCFINAYHLAVGDGSSAVRRTYYTHKEESRWVGR